MLCFGKLFCLHGVLPALSLSLSLLPWGAGGNVTTNSKQMLTLLRVDSLCLACLLWLIVVVDIMCIRCA